MSIQRLLLITFILFSIISMLLMAGFAYTRSRTVLQDEIRENMQAQAITIMQQIDAIMFERVENIYGWSRLDLMQDVKIGDVDKRLTRFLSNLKLSYAGLYDELYIVYQGKVISSSDAGMIGESWTPTEAWLSLPIQQAGIEISKPGKVAGKDSMLLSTLLSDAFTDAELGRLYARFDWTDISRLLDKAVGGTSRQVLLIDSHGDILSASSNSINEASPSFTSENGQQLINDLHGTYTQQNQSGPHGDVLVGYDTSQGIRGLPGMGWRVLVITPSAVAFAQVTQLLWTFVILLAVITFIAILLARRVAKKIASPIQALTAVTRQLPAQIETMVIDVHGQGEVAELAQAFKSMLKELKHSRERLVHLTKLAAVGEMSAILAHEVRNPLGILRSSAQLLERQSGLDDRGRTMIDYIITECDRIDNLVSSLLESARPRQSVFSDNDLNEIIGKVLELTQPKADKKGIRIDFTPGNKVTMLECDPDQMTQVILNLVLNAVQILPDDGGIVCIDAETSDDHVIIGVADNGSGIPIEEREHIFEPFVSSRSGGLGLGLVVVREIIQMHQGTCVIEDSPSGGAQFSIRIPQHRNRKPNS